VAHLQCIQGRPPHTPEPLGFRFPAPASDHPAFGQHDRYRCEAPGQDRFHGNQRRQRGKNLGVDRRQRGCGRVPALGRIHRLRKSGERRLLPRNPGRPCGGDHGSHGDHDAPDDAHHAPAVFQEKKKSVTLIAAGKKRDMAACPFFYSDVPARHTRHRSRNPLFFYEGHAEQCQQNSRGDVQYPVPQDSVKGSRFEHEDPAGNALAGEEP